MTPLLHAADLSAKCYLIRNWHRETPADLHPEDVRELADARRTVTVPAELARLRAILRLNRLKPEPPQTKDLRFVADIRRTDGSVESYYADAFYLMAADLRRSLRVDRTSFHHDVERFMDLRR